MEALLTQACVDHQLSGIGVNVFDTSTGELTVYVHWNSGDGTCASGSGKTFAEALACAVGEMAERRERRAA